MDPYDWGPIVAIVSTTIVAVTAILANAISKHKLKVEQIKADAMVRVEEVRARNQLELERLVREEQAARAGMTDKANNYEHQNEEYGRQKSRVRE